MDAQSSTDLPWPVVDPHFLSGNRKQYQSFPTSDSLLSRITAFSASNPMYGLKSPLGRPLTEVERRLPHISPLHKILDDIQVGKFSNWKTRWKMYKEVSEDVAVHQLRQELRQLYREVGADISCTNLMPISHCVDALQYEALATYILARDMGVFGGDEGATDTTPRCPIPSPIHPRG